MDGHSPDRRWGQQGGDQPDDLVWVVVGPLEHTLDAGFRRRDDRQTVRPRLLNEKLKLIDIMCHWDVSFFPSGSRATPLARSVGSPLLSTAPRATVELTLHCPRRTAPRCHRGRRKIRYGHGPTGP